MKRVGCLLLCLMLSACGGGSAGAFVDIVVAALTPSGNTLRGTAAVGAALVGADVKVRCPSTNRARYSISITAANPAVVTVSDTSELSNALIFDGQVVTLTSTGTLPAPLNSYQSYYIVNTDKSGNAIRFNLASAPTGVPIVSTNGATPGEGHTLVPSSLIEIATTTASQGTTAGTFAVDRLGDLKALSPCVLEVAPAQGAKLHSISMSLFGVANITPLTDALLATLVETSDLATYFSTFNETAASRLGQLATPDNIQAAWEKIKTGLIANGLDVSAILSEPITQPLYAAYNCGGEVEISLANPAVFKFKNSGGATSVGQAVTFKTTGSLPQALTEGQTYYVMYANAAGNEFKVSDNQNDTTPISTLSNAQSGVHLAYIGNKLCATAGNAYDQLLEKIKTMTPDALVYTGLLAGKEKLITLVKLDSHGVALKNQFAKWQDNGTEEAGTQWDCVHDTVNHVYWEVKRNDANHPRHKGHKYTWFDSTSLNGGSAGTESNTTCKGVGDPGKCNTENYAKAVNSSKLCGFDTWVVPSIDDLQKFPMNYAASVLANTDYFPDVASEPLASTAFWSRTPSANNALGSYAWTFNFGTGKVLDGLKSSARPVRLMLPVQSYAAKVTTTNGVTDYGITVATPGVVTLDSAPATPIASDQLVTLRTAGTLPQTLSQKESYYIVGANAATTSFQLSKSQSGLPLGTRPTDVNWTVMGPHFVVVGGKPAAKVQDVDTCNPAIEVTRPNTRYVVANGEVTDTQTGLIWRQCVEGLSGSTCTGGPAKAATQAEALAMAAVAAGADKKPWRLPTKQELASLVDRKCTGVWKYKTAASGLWISSRLFTVTTGWEQEVAWSNPVLVDTLGLEFSADAANWHDAAASTDVFMRSKTAQTTPVRIAGESGIGWNDGVPADPMDADPTPHPPTPLWYTKRVFSASGGSPQEASWSTPVEIQEGSPLRFSADGLNWHFPPKSSDVYMRDGPNSPAIVMRGEEGGVSSAGTTVTGVAFFRGLYVPGLDPLPRGGSFSKPIPDYPMLTASSKQGMVRGYAFYRGNLPPGTPAGGSFAYPAPQSLGWSDGIPKEAFTSDVVSAADAARAINQTKFPQVGVSPFPQAIWSSSAVPNSSAVWIVNFYDGSESTVDSGTKQIFVRLVRSP